MVATVGVRSNSKTVFVMSPKYSFGRNVEGPLNGVLPVNAVVYSLVLKPKKGYCSRLVCHFG